ncbi:hypothetical protein OIU80_20340, partial [Flavobacterium sp. LS1R47]|nr:hypothetical protein [Flavobacterium frigoritolerans]
KVLTKVTTVSNTLNKNELSTIVNGVTGNVVDLTAAIKTAETVTAITPIVTGRTIATYTNETTNAPVEIQETITSIAPVAQITGIETRTIARYVNETTNAPVEIKETVTSLSYDGTAHSLDYIDEDGFENKIKMVDLIGDAETLTKLEVNTTTSTLDYTDEKVTTPHALDLTPLIKEPWFSTTTNTGATSNKEDIYTGGWVGIGYETKSDAPNEMLRVKGSITTVNSYFADYVFEDYFKGFSDIKAEYKFKSLSEVDAYIRKNKHLPGITPITKLEKTAEGYAFNLSELSIQLLEKTEELYLHVIEQDKQLDAKNNEIQELKANSKVMNERLEKLEKLILEKNNY